VSDAATYGFHSAYGVTLLARDLTPAELSDAPVLGSVDTLLIDDLTDDEDDAFASALGS